MHTSANNWVRENVEIGFLEPGGRDQNEAPFSCMFQPPQQEGL
jgi:hypothetical protein